MIEIKRTEVVTVVAEDGTELRQGSTYIIIANDKAYYGVFVGLSSRGTLCFEYKGINYGLAPKSVKEVEEV